MESYETYNGLTRDEWWLVTFFSIDDIRIAWISNTKNGFLMFHYCVDMSWFSPACNVEIPWFYRFYPLVIKRGNGTCPSQREVSMENNGKMYKNVIHIFECGGFSWFIELDDGKIYRKALYLMVKTMVSCRFSLKPIQWIMLYIHTCSIRDATCIEHWSTFTPNITQFCR